MFIFTLNLVGIVLTATGHWPYAKRYTSALVLGNIHVAVLVRNELFGRLLYLVVNTLFAKVSAFTSEDSHYLVRLVRSGAHFGSDWDALRSYR